MNVLESDYESYPPHTRIPDEEIQAIYVELTFNGEYRLLPYEEEWRDCGPLINHSGYQLRRRYDMDWTPSWENTTLNPFYCEDSIDLSTPNVIDAVRINDGLPVAIKRTLAWTTEASIAFLFTDEGAVEEPHNHCVPILDTFIEEDSVYIVMPLLRPFNDPPFLAVGEVIDFISQLVEGIEYMHQQNVAHRDITAGNIMMDASELYPEGFHPVRQNLSKNGIAEVVGVMRTHAPVRYYLIDFDSAIAFEKGTPSKEKYAEGKAGRDDAVPEFKINGPYDPFKVDIFQFGNLLKKEFLQKYTGVEFLEPLVREMTRPRPLERPSASTLRVRFNTVRNRLGPSQMRAHLNLKDATDPFRERLLQLGIESLLDSDLDDSPEHSSSEAPTTGNSNRSHDSYWSAVQSMDSSITSQSSIEQQPSKGPLNMFTDMFSRSRSPSRPTPQEAKGSAIPWKPVKPREPSPPPERSAPQSIASSKDQHQPRDDSPERSRLKTGRFPWSPSSSPDSVGSPILAVVNQFLQPDTSHTYGDVFDNDYTRRPTFSDDRMGREQAFAAPQYPAPPKAPTPAAAGPSRNRRNTVNAAPAPPPAPAKVTPEPSARPKLRTGTFDSSYGAPAAPAGPAEYAFFGAPSNRPVTSTYGKQNKSSNALPMFSNSNNYGWDSQPSHEQAHTGYFDMPQYEEAEGDGTLWTSQEALSAMNQPPPVKPSAPRSTEKKELTPEKKTKASKSPFSTLSKKSAPSEPVTSTTTSNASTLRAGLGSKSLFAAASANRKSTIAVEDGTPFNTPPKTTLNLPSPSTSPVASKVKKAKSKKGSISETPKEAPKEKEVIPLKDDDFSLPPIHDDFSTGQMKRRGSGASGTPRPTSPMAMFLGSRSMVSSSKKENTSKPTPFKPSPFKPSTFGWGSKAKPSPPAETDFHTDNFSSGASAFSSGGWKNKADEPSSMALVRSPATSPNEGGNSDYDMASEPISTPPTKSGWKTKTSYFPTSTWDAKPSANSPKEEDDDLAHLYAQMNKAEATPKAPVSFDFSGNFPSFQFNTSAADKEGDDFWPGVSRNAKATSTKAETAKPVEEPSPSLSKSKTMKSKVDVAPEPIPTEVKPIVTKGKNKKAAAKAITKPTIAVESPQPTPTSGSEDLWSYGASAAAPQKAAKAEPIKAKDPWSLSPPAPAQKASKAQPPVAKANEPWSFGPNTTSASKPDSVLTKAAPAAKRNSNEPFGDWFGNNAEDEEDNELLEEDPAASNEAATPEVVDSWFSTIKPKAASKASQVPAPAPVVAPKTVKGKKGAKVESSPQLEAVQEPTVTKMLEQSTPDVEESTGDVDNWWSQSAAGKAGAKAKAAKGATAEASKPKAIPEVNLKGEEKEDDWWSVPTTKGKKGKNAKESESVQTATPAANKWASINFNNEEATAEEDLTADLAATLGKDPTKVEETKAEEPPKSPEPEAPVAEEVEKPTPKATAAKNNAKGGKKKGKR